MTHPEWYQNIYRNMRFDEPCPEEHMHGRNDGRFICHVLRKIYDMVDDEEARRQLRIATTMGKKMSFKLQEHGVGWKELWSEDGQKK